MSNSLQIEPDEQDSQARNRRHNLRLAISLAICIPLSTALFVLIAAIGFPYAGWDTWKDKREAFEKSRKLPTYEALVPGAIPDDQNFVMIPEFAPLHAFLALGPEARGEGEPAPIVFPEIWGLTASGKKALLDVADQKRQNVEELRAALAESGCASANGEAAIAVLAAVEAHSRVFNAIEAGVKRNSSRWPVRYDLGFSMAPPPWPSLRQLTYLFAIRSLARRSAGMPQEAADDVVTLLRLARALQRDPLLVSTMIGVAIERAALSEIWDGMASHAWSGSCLARFRGELLDVDEFASWHRSVLFEGIAMTRLLESAIREEKPVWGLRDDESNEVHWAICRSAGGDDRIHHDP